MPTFKKTLRHALCAVLMAAMPLAHAAAPTVGAASPAARQNEALATQRLTALLGRINSLQASFVQTTSGARATAVRPGGTLRPTHLNQSFSGVMQVRRPGSFRWETTHPMKQLIVTNGQKVSIYDPDLAQLTRQDLGEQVANTPALLLSGQTARIMQAYRITQPNPALNSYSLYPRSGEAAFERLDIAFNKGLPVMMVLHDSLGQQTSIRFSNVQLNPKLDAALFNFVPPQGTDVIDQ